jgi:hypothetical protein
MLEGQIEAIFRPVFELKHRIFIMAPVLFPRCSPSTNQAGCGGDFRNCEFVPRGHERMEAIIKVGKKQNWSSGKGLHQRGLVDTIERARLDLADSREGQVSHYAGGDNE